MSLSQLQGTSQKTSLDGSFQVHCFAALNVRYCWQKAFGTNYGLTAKVSKDAFSYTAGTPKEHKGDTGVCREFCGTCGSYILEYGVRITVPCQPLVYLSLFCMAFGLEALFDNFSHLHLGAAGSCSPTFQVYLCWQSRRSGGFASKGRIFLQPTSIMDA